MARKFTHYFSKWIAKMNWLKDATKSFVWYFLNNLNFHRPLGDISSAVPLTVLSSGHHLGYVGEHQPYLPCTVQSTDRLYYIFSTGDVSFPRLRILLICKLPCIPGWLDNEQYKYGGALNEGLEWGGHECRGPWTCGSQVRFQVISET